MHLNGGAPLDRSHSAPPKHPSPLADGGYVYLGELEEDLDGWIEVGDDVPPVRWKYLKSTAGWTILQHQRFYRREITVPSSHGPTSTTTAFSLLGAAEFSLRQLFPVEGERTWYNGDIYSYDGPPHMVALDSGAVYEITVTFAYDVRAAGDSKEDGVPRSRWRLVISYANGGVHPEESRSVAPGILDGWTLGDLVGVELRNQARTILTLTNASTPIHEISLDPVGTFQLAPFQSAQLPLLLKQHRAVACNLDRTYQLPVFLSFSDNSTISFNITLIQLFANKPLLSTFYTNSRAVSYALYTPPRDIVSASSGVILALHGAGVDPAKSPEWTSSIKRRRSEWIVWPIGLTEWGYDWHGASLSDSRAALYHLSNVQQYLGRATGISVPPSDAHRRIVIMGHSNGGQGTWYHASRFPDEVVAAIPAAGYVKIQDYVPYSHSVGPHFRDPALNGILHAALAQFDNDLHVSNLKGMPLLCRHGGNDDNVPVQNSRQLVTAVELWNGPSAQIEFFEVDGEGHWFDNVLNTPEIDQFLDSAFESENPIPENFTFTITCANPSEMGSKLGFRILELETPGRLARLDIEIFKDPQQSLTIGRVTTKNVKTFGVKGRPLHHLEVNGIVLSPVPPGTNSSSQLWVTSASHSQWIFSLGPPASLIRQSVTLLSILASSSTIQIVIGTTGSADITQHLESIASRLSHDAYLYGKVKTTIVRDFEVGVPSSPGNLVVLGDKFSNSLVRRWAVDWTLPVTFVSPNAFRLGSETYQANGTGLLFLAPVPHRPSDLALVLNGIGYEGLERAARLFPVRTGVPLPDWVVTSPTTVDGGVAAAGFWSKDWDYNPSMSFP
ncbi:alpha/beta-hydrolase [Meredithblackwellia eburnea MCA 4105]